MCKFGGSPSGKGRSGGGNQVGNPPNGRGRTVYASEGGTARIHLARGSRTTKRLGQSRDCLASMLTAVAERATIGGGFHAERTVFGGSFVP